MENSTLFKEKNGQELYNKSLEGDAEAGYLFGQLVLKNNYIIDPIDDLKKKELKVKGAKDAEEAIVKAAEANHLPSMIDAADMYFSGRIESGSFPSRLLLPKYKNSSHWYAQLLTQDIDDETRALALFRLGLIAYMIEYAVSSSTLDYWTQASLLPSVSANHALAHIAQYHYDKKDYVVAVPLLENIYQEKPYSAILLAMCYKNGYGVDIDIKKHDELMLFWKTETDKK